MFVVYQDGKRADCHTYNVHRSWHNCEFDNFFDAAAYAIHWAMPVDKVGAEMIARALIDRGYIRPNEPVDLSHCEVPVMMEIREE